GMWYKNRPLREKDKIYLSCLCASRRRCYQENELVQNDGQQQACPDSSGRGRNQRSKMGVGKRHHAAVSKHLPTNTRFNRRSIQSPLSEQAFLSRHRSDEFRVQSSN